MATAIKRTVEHLVTDTLGVDLKLDMEEAQTLTDILCRIGGHMTDSRRKHAQAILNTMRDAGIEYAADPEDLKGSDSIHFAETDPQPSRMECGCA